VHYEDLERILTPLGTLIKCEKIASSGNGGGGGGGSGGASTGSQEDLSLSQATTTGALQTIEVVFETPEEAEKYTHLFHYFCCFIVFSELQTHRWIK